MNIVITDDHAVVREGMKFLLSTTDDLKVIKDVDSGEALIKFLEVNHEAVDLILLDLVMPELNGIDILEIIKRDYPKIKVVNINEFHVRRIRSPCIE